MQLIIYGKNIGYEEKCPYIPDFRTSALFGLTCVIRRHQIVPLAVLTGRATMRAVRRTQRPPRTHTVRAHADIRLACLVLGGVDGIEAVIPLQLRGVAHGDGGSELHLPSGNELGGDARLHGRIRLQADGQTVAHRQTRFGGGRLQLERLSRRDGETGARQQSKRRVCSNDQRPVQSQPGSPLQDQLRVCPQLQHALGRTAGAVGLDAQLSILLNVDVRTGCGAHICLYPRGAEGIRGRGTIARATGAVPRAS